MVEPVVSDFASSSAPIIGVEHVFKSVSDSTGTLTILRDIDFALQARETAAIVGASGSGKSTLLALIAGLDTPTQGTVRLAGQDIFALSEDDRAALRAQKVGVVFQSFQLMGNLTALENVMLPLELSGVRQARALATEMLQRVGLSQRLSHYPKVLSGGEQQRVALARAFVVKPAVLLADEPTGSLDFATGDTVMRLMFELNEELGTTLVLVTHDPAIAARCQRRITIEAGRISASVAAAKKGAAPPDSVLAAIIASCPLPPKFFSVFMPSACGSKPRPSPSLKFFLTPRAAMPACASSPTAPAKPVCA